MADIDIAPSGQIGSIRKAINHASWYMWTLGWLLIVALGFKFSQGYFQFSKDFDQQIDRGVVAGGFMILLIGTVFREITRIRKEKYANIQNELHSINHAIRDTITYLQELEQKDLSIDEIRPSFGLAERQIGFILDKFSGIFSMLTGTYCRSSIKQIYEIDEDQFFVFTLARDKDSARENAQTDLDRFEKNSDPLLDNEDYSLLFDDRKRWFFSNNLPRRATYSNSKDRTIGTGDRNNMLTWLDLIFPAKGWKLPYVSTIVWPIQQKETKDVPLSNIGCVAFLTIDSAYHSVFKERYDTFLGASVADSIFHLLILFNKLSDRLDEKQLEADDD